MNSIDFSQIGGMKFTQDQLAYLQSAYTAALVGIAAAGGSGPVILSGVQEVPLTGLFSPGWILYNGELLPFSNTVHVPIGIGQVLVVSIQETDTPVAFFDGTNKNVLHSRYAILASGTNTSTPTQFPFSALAPYGKEAAFSTAAVAISPATGSVSYRKNTLNNTLQIKGSLNVVVASVAATGTFSGPTYYNIAMLAAAYCPATDTPFSCYYRYHDAPILDDTGVDHITQVNGELMANGNLNVGLIKAASNYTLYFNLIIPLD